MLKPCPFCGNKAFTTDWTERRIGLGCSNCGVSVHFYTNDPNEAIAGWNRRAAQQEPEATRRLEKMIAMLEASEGLRMEHIASLAAACRAARGFVEPWASTSEHAATVVAQIDAATAHTPTAQAEDARPAVGEQSEELDKR